MRISFGANLDVISHLGARKQGRRERKSVTFNLEPEVRVEDAAEAGEGDDDVFSLSGRKQVKRTVVRRIRRTRDNGGEEAKEPESEARDEDDRPVRQSRESSPSL